MAFSNVSDGKSKGLDGNTEMLPEGVLSGESGGSPGGWEYRFRMSESLMGFNMGPPFAYGINGKGPALDGQALELVI